MLSGHIEGALGKKHHKRHKRVWQGPQTPHVMQDAQSPHARLAQAEVITIVYLWSESGILLLCFLRDIASGFQDFCYIFAFAST